MPWWGEVYYAKIKLFTGACRWEVLAELTGAKTLMYFNLGVRTRLI